ncbi:hypothetical protein C7B62_18630 [Pleurocapsa sp. CCALA 161]|uniref:hypothetical protein n=1 Tax=Pleurocapsa sp. CCALA 161 TaxID=2107688 RepID=UPI000D0489E1|nr:hypothetical protein [Pleurocapsa sp. CCALA 161]PSB07855.1 hypothetical protein C7B62_18630 [Pleurocapsa sp. CCALA 161]
MNFLKSSLWLGLALASIYSTIAVKSIQATEIPTQTYDMINEDNSWAGTLEAPNFSAITLRSLGSFSASGFIPDDYVGYSLGRQWQAGDAVIDVLKLGDLDEALGIGRMRLGEIVTKSGHQFHEVTLDRLGFIEEQTVASFIQANPQLKSESIENVPPLADLVTLIYGDRARIILSLPVQVLIDVRHQSQFNPISLNKSLKTSSNKTFTLSQSETQAPKIEISEVEMGELDLSQYTLEDVSGMEDSFVEDFEGWKNEYAGEVEGLADISLDNFPNPVATTLAFVSRVDTIWSDAHGEIKSGQSVAGSNIAGYAVPCQTQCAHIELDDLENSGRDIRWISEGRRWMLGNDPNNANICPEAPWGVDGGEGILGEVNCGKEPTGRNPFGPTFKVALWNVDETTDTAETSIFFRICIRFPVDLGCTPYFIGPIPWLPANREDWIILGPGL